MDSIELLCVYIYLYINRIEVLQNWNCEPMCLLSAEYYAEDRPLSKATIKGLADLSELVSADEGRELLTHEIECRSRGGMKDGKRSYHRDLILSDVTEAIDKVKTKQLENVTTDHCQVTAQENARVDSDSNVR